MPLVETRVFFFFFFARSTDLNGEGAGGVDVGLIDCVCAKRAFVSESEVRVSVEARESARKEQAKEKGSKEEEGRGRLEQMDRGDVFGDMARMLDEEQSEGGGSNASKEPVAWDVRAHTLEVTAARRAGSSDLLEGLATMLERSTPRPASWRLNKSGALVSVRKSPEEVRAERRAQRRKLLIAKGLALGIVPRPEPSLTMRMEVFHKRMALRKLQRDDRHVVDVWIEEERQAAKANRPDEKKALLRILSGPVAARGREFFNQLRNNSSSSGDSSPRSLDRSSAGNNSSSASGSNNTNNTNNKNETLTLPSRKATGSLPSISLPGSARTSGAATPSGEPVGPSTPKSAPITARDGAATASPRVSRVQNGLLRMLSEEADGNFPTRPRSASDFSRTPRKGPERGESSTPESEMTTKEKRAALLQLRNTSSSGLASYSTGAPALLGLVRQSAQDEESTSLDTVRESTSLDIPREDSVEAEKPPSSSRSSGSEQSASDGTAARPTTPLKPKRRSHSLDETTTAAQTPPRTSGATEAASPPSPAATDASPSKEVSSPKLGNKGKLARTLSRRISATKAKAGKQLTQLRESIEKAKDSKRDKNSSVSVYIPANLKVHSAREIIDCFHFESQVGGSPRAEFAQPTPIDTMLVSDTAFCVALVDHILLDANLEEQGKQDRLLKALMEIHKVHRCFHQFCTAMCEKDYVARDIFVWRSRTPLTAVFSLCCREQGALNYLDTIAGPFVYSFCTSERPKFAALFDRFLSTLEYTLVRLPKALQCVLADVDRICGDPRALGLFVFVRFLLPFVTHPAHQESAPHAKRMFQAMTRALGAIASDITPPSKGFTEKEMSAINLQQALMNRDFFYAPLLRSAALVEENEILPDVPRDVYEMLQGELFAYIAQQIDAGALESPNAKLTRLLRQPRLQLDALATTIESSEEDDALDLEDI